MYSGNNWPRDQFEFHMRAYAASTHIHPQNLSMSSCKPIHSSTSSDDLRWSGRMVWQRDRLGYTCIYDDIARNVCVNKLTVNQIRLSGNVSKKTYPIQRCVWKLIRTSSSATNSLVGNGSQDITKRVKSVSCSLMLTSLPSVNLKKNVDLLDRNCTPLPCSKSVLMAAVHMWHVCIQPDMFVFIESDNRNALRKYGYSLRGETPVNHALLVGWEWVSAIACMSIAGLLDVKTIMGLVMEMHSMNLSTHPYCHA